MASAQATTGRPVLLAVDAADVHAGVLLHGEALASADPTLRFIGHALTWLARYVPAQLALFYPVDRRLGKFDSGPIVAWARADALPRLTWSISRYRQHHHAHDPFAPRRFADSPHGVVDVRDVADPQAFARSTYARDFLAGLGMYGQTTLYLRTRGRIAAGVDLLRAGDAGYGGAQPAFLRTTHAFLEHAYACAIDTTPAPVTSEHRGKQPLTRREAEVARLVADGASNAEIACALSITEGTVKTHLVHVFAKLGVRSRTQLAVLVNSQVDGDRARPLLTVAADDSPDSRSTSSPPRRDYARRASDTRSTGGA